MNKISVVIMNWLRSEYLINDILPAMVEYNMIDEIIISHGREDTIFDFEHTKVVHRDDSSLNKPYGLCLRFLAASDAKNDTILIMDDDGFPTEFVIERLLEEHNKNPNRLVGVYGQGTKNGNYNYHDRYGDVPVVLTKCMLMKKELCYQFFKHAPVIEDLIKKGKPYWNGEDVFMAAVSRYYYGNENFAVPGLKPHMIDPIGGRENKNPRAISSWKGHRWFRNDVLHFCKDYFKIWDGMLR